MSKRTPKNHKNWHNTPVVLCWHEKFFGSNKRQWILFRPQRWDVLYRNHHACCEKLQFVRSIYPNLHQMGQKIYPDMLMPLHDGMPSFMNFRQILDVLEFKNQDISTFCRQSTVPWCLNFHPISCMGPRIHQRTHMWFFTQLWCTGACAWSSNLNYADKMPWKLS